LRHAAGSDEESDRLSEPFQGAPLVAHTNVRSAILTTNHAPWLHGFLLYHLKPRSASFPFSSVFELKSLGRILPQKTMASCLKERHRPPL